MGGARCGGIFSTFFQDIDQHLTSSSTLDLFSPLQGDLYHTINLASSLVNRNALLDVIVVCVGMEEASEMA